MSIILYGGPRVGLASQQCHQGLRVLTSTYSIILSCQQLSLWGHKTAAAENFLSSQHPTSRVGVGCPRISLLIFLSEKILIKALNDLCHFGRNEGWKASVCFQLLRILPAWKKWTGSGYWAHLLLSSNRISTHFSSLWLRQSFHG
jgi:hypothetical protein